MWVLVLALASCQEVAEPTAKIEPVTFEPGYPNLHTVPPRPQLSYTIEQRRAIADGLIADRTNARYRSDVVRYRAGLSTVPPAPAPPALAAVPLAPQPEAPDAADGSTPPGPGRDAPVVDPGTEVLYEDDNLGNFMDEMVDERIGPPGGPSGPESNAAPLGASVMQASADGVIARAAAYATRSPVVTLAMPPKAARLPVPDAAGAPLVSRATPARALPPPPAIEQALAGRAPGVVWGMPDMAPPPDARLLAMADASADRPPTAPSPGSAVLEPDLAGRAPGVVWGMPDMAPQSDLPPRVVADASSDRARPAPFSTSAVREPSLAARAPGVVWGMPDLAPAAPPPAAPTPQIAHADAGSQAAPISPPLKPAGAPAETVVAGDAAKPAPAPQVPRRAAPPAPAPVKPAQPAPAETALASRAPDQVLQIPETSAAATAKATRPGPAVMLAAAPLPAPAKPPVDQDARDIAPVTAAAAVPPQPGAGPVTEAAAIEIEDGLVALPPSAGRRHAGGVLGSVPFDPQSAMLSPHAVARLTEYLADAKAQDARIEIVGEAPAPALALDRALAVGLALVQSGVSADRLELTLARGGSGDQARLFLAAPAL